jgi:hypothetical protein
LYRTTAQDYKALFEAFKALTPGNRLELEPTGVSIGGIDGGIRGALTGYDSRHLAKLFRRRERIIREGLEDMARRLSEFARDRETVVKYGGLKVNEILAMEESERGKVLGELKDMKAVGPQSISAVTFRGIGNLEGYRVILLPTYFADVQSSNESISSAICDAVTFTALGNNLYLQPKDSLAKKVDIPFKERFGKVTRLNLALCGGENTSTVESIFTGAQQRLNASPTTNGITLNFVRDNPFYSFCFDGEKGG